MAKVLRRRRAFTLVELLVVIAIIGVLVGLLLPAVQAAREVARKMTCSANLKNIAMALQEYAGSHKRFPPAAVYVGDPSNPATYAWATFNPKYHNYLDFPVADFRDNGWGATWVTMLLPYLEQQNLADTYNNKLPAGHPANAGVVSKSLEILQCPSTFVVSPANMPNGYVGVFAKSNYAVNTGGKFANASTAQDFGWEDVRWRSPFSFRPTYGAALEEFDPDGTSNTIILSEILGYESNDDTRGCWGRVGGAIFSMHVGNRSRCAEDSLIATPNVDWRVDRCFYDCPTHCADNADPGCDDCPIARARGGIAARSKHWGGVNAAMADGAVRFVANTIDPNTWRALLTMTAGDTVGEY